MKNFKSVLDFIENSFAAIALVGIFAVATFLVLALNPVPKNGTVSVSDESNSLVNFAKDLKEDSIKPLEVENIYNHERHDTLLKDSQKVYTFTIEPRSLEAGMLDVPALKIKNPNNSPVKFQIISKISGPVLTSLNLSISDQSNSAKLFTIEQGSIDRTFAIAANGEMTYVVNYDVKERINFPFTVELVIE